MSKVMDKHDQWIEGNNSIVKDVVRHFKNMVTQETHHSIFESLDFIERCITEDDNSMLASIPTTEEIKDRIFSIDKVSAQGSDGLSGHFYQSSWNIICCDLYKVIELFFMGENLPKFITHTCFVMIPMVSPGSLLT